MEDTKMAKPTPQQAMARAIAILGSQAAAARAAGLSPAMVWQMSTGRKPVPLRAGLALESATHGLVAATDLCPAQADLVRAIERSITRRVAVRGTT
jgi:DNA-binding transcriptional regulator YdaS (Cro superfamily)